MNARQRRQFLRRSRRLARAIPEMPILLFLASLDAWGTTFVYQDEGEPMPKNCVFRAMPQREKTPTALGRARMELLIDAGWVDGCVCGCRGDFDLTARGRVRLASLLKNEIERECAPARSVGASRL